MVTPAAKLSDVFREPLGSLGKIAAGELKEG
jgi:hypothetical protein